MFFVCSLGTSNLNNGFNINGDISFHVFLFLNCKPDDSFR
ncbi:unnamed protein product [Brassica oleracea var. botrytis]|uniref:Uncharacterized protein n=1 Tax=Brassica campestris TaxID=3711 RepID=A0A8D9LPC6_BRACM|nr:unnamed protein product [Brassica rapa]